MLQALGTCKTRSFCPPRGISLSSLRKQGEPGHLWAGCGPLTFTERGFVAGMSAQSLIWEARFYLGRAEGGRARRAVARRLLGSSGQGKMACKEGDPCPSSGWATGRWLLQAEDSWDLPGVGNGCKMGKGCPGQGISHRRRDFCWQHSVASPSIVLSFSLTAQNGPVSWAELTAKGVSCIPCPVKAGYIWAVRG